MTDYIPGWWARPGGITAHRLERYIDVRPHLARGLTLCGRTLVEPRTRRWNQDVACCKTCDRIWWRELGDLVRGDEIRS